MTTSVIDRLVDETLVNREIVKAANSSFRPTLVGAGIGGLAGAARALLSDYEPDEKKRRRQLILNILGGAGAGGLAFNAGSRALTKKEDVPEGAADPRGVVLEGPVGDPASPRENPRMLPLIDREMPEKLPWIAGGMSGLAANIQPFRDAVRRVRAEGYLPFSYFEEHAYRPGAGPRVGAKNPIHRNLWNTLNTRVDSNQSKPKGKRGGGTADSPLRARLIDHLTSVVGPYDKEAPLSKKQISDALASPASTSKVVSRNDLIKAIRERLNAIPDPGARTGEMRTPVPEDLVQGALDSAMRHGHRTALDNTRRLYHDSIGMSRPDISMPRRVAGVTGRGLAPIGGYFGMHLLTRPKYDNSTAGAR